MIIIFALHSSPSPSLPHSLSLSLSLSPSLIVLRTCSITRDNCEVTYQVGIYVLGTEGSITVLFDQSQDDINDWSGKEQYI